MQLSYGMAGTTERGAQSWPDTGTVHATKTGFAQITAAWNANWLACSSLLNTHIITEYTQL